MKSYLKGIAMAGLLLSTDAYAQSRQQSEVIYQNGRIIILPRQPPAQSLAVRKTGNDLLAAYTDRRKGTTTTSDVTENLRNYLADRQRRAEQLLQELRSKGYIR